MMNAYKVFISYLIFKANYAAFNCMIVSMWQKFCGACSSRTNAENSIKLNNYRYLHHDINWCHHLLEKIAQQAAALFRNFLVFGIDDRSWLSFCCKDLCLHSSLRCTAMMFYPQFLWYSGLGFYCMELHKNYLL